MDGLGGSASQHAGCEDFGLGPVGLQNSLLDGGNLGERHGKTRASESDEEGDEFRSGSHFTAYGHALACLVDLSDRRGDHAQHARVALVVVL